MPNIRPHGTGVRGADLSRSSPLFEGRFGRIFRSLPPGDYGSNDTQSMASLAALGAAMVGDPDPVKDGADAEESGIPAAYTYLGQFIDHDLTFDPASALQKQDDPDALIDYRTPAFDLDNVYGRGPDDQPYLYEDDGIRFILGAPLTGAAANPGARDLPRSTPSSGARRAIIGDPRNDENVIVSQLQGLMHRFHNRIAADNPAWGFERVQREVRYHYQWTVLHDFLPTVVSPEALAAVFPEGDLSARPSLQLYKYRREPFIPLEFSVAAYRFGHSMVRPGYRLSETMGPLPVFTDDPGTTLGLTGFDAFPDNWAIDWNIFADLKPRDKDDTTRLQLAYRIDTSLVDPLGHLPARVAANPSSLAARNLLRGWRMRLPTGQSVARAMALPPLADADIKIGKFTGDPADIKGSITDVAGAAFAGNCPLWTYVLAETVEVPITLTTTGGDIGFQARKLGPVGGRIVAETFAGLLLGDNKSFLNLDPLWRPSLASNGRFGLRELIGVALS